MVLTHEGQVSRRMARVLSVNTRPELVLRRSLWHKGFRYRTNDKLLPGSPDIVFPKYRSVVFVHGCFWHGHSGCKNYTIPKTNMEFWVAKVARNQERDQKVWRELEAKGWNIIIVWECQLKKEKLKETVEKIAEEIVQNGAAFCAAQEERKKARDAYRHERRARKEKEHALMAEVKTL